MTTLPGKLTLCAAIAGVAFALGVAGEAEIVRQCERTHRMICVADTNAHTDTECEACDEYARKQCEVK